VLIYIGSKAAWISTLQLERSSRQTPFDPQIWWYKWVIPFSALLLALQALVESIKTIRSLKDGGTQEN
jgi:TRAP-type mannitol/chloroaromatic compound transport system permease small subunit